MDSRGQSVVEYVLILIISISLLLALTAQVFTPLQAFLKSYLGDYVACLLETGELPSLGNEDARTALQDMGCNSRFEPGTFTAGRPPKSSSSSSSSSSSKPRSESSNSSSSSGSESDSKSSRSGSSSASVRSSSQFDKPSRGLESSGGGSGDKVTGIPISGSSAESSFMNRQGSWGSNSSSSGQKKLAVGIAGMTEDEKKKLERKSSSVRNVASGESFGKTNKKVSIKKPEPKVVEDEEEPMTFGNFLKFLLIVAIVIALVVVLGGQALNISKSGE